MLVCVDCKFVQGHPLTFCPGCGRRLVKMDLSDLEFKTMREHKWRMEGQSDLYEYFYQGKPVDFSFNDSNWANFIIYRIIERYPWMSSLDCSFDKFKASFYPERSVHLNYRDGTGMYIDFSPVSVRWRLKGSTLPICDNEEKEQLKLAQEELSKSLGI